MFRSGGRVPKEKLIYDGETLDYTDTAEYLGFIFHYNGSWFVNAKQRLMKASKALGALRRRIYRFHLPISTKIQLYNQLVLSVLMYGCELWGTTRNRSYL